MVLLIALAGLTSCSPRPLPVDPTPKTNSITLRLAADGALFLEGNPLYRRNLAKELAKISDRLRVDARLAGEPIASDRGLSTCIIYQMDGKTPFSTVYNMATEAQSAGFRQWSVVLDSVTNDPARMQPLGTSPARVSPAGNGDLPVELRTIPIRLHANDRGEVVRIGLNEREFADFEALRVELVSIVSDPENSFDRAVLIVDGGLDFAELVRAVNLIASLNIGTIDLSLEAPVPIGLK
jgi:biopolymer transport protein ExbD